MKSKEYIHILGILILFGFVLITDLWVDLRQSYRIAALEQAKKATGVDLSPKQSDTHTQLSPKPESGLKRTLVRFRVTAYCKGSCCCGNFADGITASGHKIKQGDRFVAAPPEYAFGTIMDIPTYGKVKVLDRGGAIKGNRLDLYFDSHQAALNWGIKNLDVEIAK